MVLGENRQTPKCILTITGNFTLKTESTPPFQSMWIARQLEKGEMDQNGNFNFENQLIPSLPKYVDCTAIGKGGNGPKREFQL
jgi:hypothetical protein